MPPSPIIESRTFSVKLHRSLAMRRPLSWRTKLIITHWEPDRLHSRNRTLNAIQRPGWIVIAGCVTCRAPCGAAGQDAAEAIRQADEAWWARGVYRLRPNARRRPLADGAERAGPRHWPARHEVAGRRDSGREWTCWQFAERGIGRWVAQREIAVAKLGGKADAPSAACQGNKRGRLDWV